MAYSSCLRWVADDWKPTAGYAAFFFSSKNTTFGYISNAAREIVTQCSFWILRTLLSSKTL
jgi:hypothetical protein